MYSLSRTPFKLSCSRLRRSSRAAKFQVITGTTTVTITVKAKLWEA
jgi:hypothetical protein